MEIINTSDNDTTILQIAGRIDTNTAPTLEKEIRAVLTTPAVTFVLDLAGVAYVSSAGLRAFMMGNREAMKVNKTIVLRSMRQEIMDVFKMTGLSKLFTIE